MKILQKIPNEDSIVIVFGELGVSQWVDHPLLLCTVSGSILGVAGEIYFSAECRLAGGRKPSTTYVGHQTKRH